MSSSDEVDVDDILGEADMEEIENMYVSPQENWQEILGVVPAPTNNDVINTAGLAPRDGSIGELRGGGPCQRPSLSLPLMVFLRFHSRLVSVLCTFYRPNTTCGLFLQKMFYPYCMILFLLLSSKLVISW